MQPLLRLESVSKSYDRGSSALSVLINIDLEVPSGDWVGIMGASGSGKSTLLNLLGCLDRPASGRYWLDGQDVARLDDDALSRIRNRSIGFVFQSFQLIPQLTVLENVEVPLFYARVPHRKRRARALELLGAVGLTERLEHHPFQLSGGEQQRVAIARALVNDPALILADEPTGNLDSASGEEVLRILADLHRSGRTIVMVTHNPEIARRLPRVVEMRDGRLLQQE